jgi:hypothetical protein
MRSVAKVLAERTVRYWPISARHDRLKSARSCHSLHQCLTLSANEHKKTAKAQAYAAANVEAEQVKTTKVQTLTVQDLAKAWLLDGVARKDGNAELQRRFNKDLFPALGKTAVSSVSEHYIRALIRTVVNRGAYRQAISFFADLTQMFGWARKRQPWRALLVEGDPTELVDITPTDPSRLRGGKKPDCWRRHIFHSQAEISLTQFRTPNSLLHFAFRLLGWVRTASAPGSKLHWQ